MKVDLNRPLFVKFKFIEARRDNCKHCIFSTQDKSCLASNVPCAGGHWELDEIFPQSDVTFDMQQIQDSINSVDSKMQQIKEEVQEEPKYFY